MPPFIDLTGRRFGRLTVRGRSDNRHHQPRWACVCGCGREVIVYGTSLREGLTLSCGCLHRERITLHGLSKSSEFTIWQMMIQRCENVKHRSYPRYGGRGITVCARWRASFSDFLADVGRRPSMEHTLDRINNALGYMAGNCRWATVFEQHQNKSNTRLLEFDGQRLGVKAWGRRLGIPKSTIINRLNAGWSIDRVLAVS